MSGRTSRRAAAGIAGLVILLGAEAPGADGGKAGTPPPAMRKLVTEGGSFALYAPDGWSAREGVQDGARSLAVADPAGLVRARLLHGAAPAGAGLVPVARGALGRLAKDLPDLTVTAAKMSRERDRLLVEGSCAAAPGLRREFRAWAALSNGAFLFSAIDAAGGKLEQERRLLLGILANVRILKGAFETAAPATEALSPYRLRDGSASFEVPPAWRVTDLGKGAFVALDPAGTSCFMVASAEVLAPGLGVNVPGAPVSPYLPPHRALPFLASRQGLLPGFRLDGPVAAREDLRREISRVYTLGPVTVEEFAYGFTGNGRPCRGASFGISFGSRLGVNWRFWHMTVTAPADRFEASVPTLVAMADSYRIDDAFAQGYIRQGLANLRRMQAETVRIVARNAGEIREMMQAAYDERRKSADYIDDRRTRSIRGEQDWISSMEGGTVYRSDRWGTRNLATGEALGEGEPFDSLHFEGGRNAYGETMTPVDTRELYEKHVAPVTGR